MQALRLTAWQHGPELQEVPDPEPGPGQVLVRTVAPGPVTRTSI
jgi:NADPH:quinone reductase-like Zn-dependent oxidoreductase